MRIKELKQVLKDYHEKKSMLVKEFNAQKASYSVTYGNGAKFNEVIGKLQDGHETNMKKLAEELKGTIDQTFSEIESRMIDFVTNPVPDDLVSTIAAIKNFAGSITENEVAAYLSKYKDNYTAKKAIANVLFEEGSPKKYEALVESYDRAKDSLDLGRSLIDKFLESSGSYQYNLLLAENGNPLDDIDENIESFLGE